MINVLHKILPNYNSKQFNAFIAKSLFVSADNGHALHPNYSKLYDDVNSPPLGSGVSIKYDMRGSYATDLMSALPVKLAAEKAGVELLPMMSRNDKIAGSTIGPIVSTSLGIKTSIREIVSVKDVQSLVKLMTELFNNYENYMFK